MFILKGKVQQHRQWMTRSFAVGPGVFLGARVLLGVTGVASTSSMYPALIWTSIALAIPLADIVLQWQESSRTRVAPARSW